MAYVDGFVLPLPRKNLAAYRRMSAAAGRVWKDHGALEYRECVGDDLNIRMGLPFPRMVKPREWVLTITGPTGDDEGPSAMNCGDGVCGWVEQALLLCGASTPKVTHQRCRFRGATECLSEVVVDGKPLTKQEFDRDAQTAEGVKSLDVHFPRFGAVKLLELANKRRFVTSLDDASRAARLLQ
jgi:hypothetical protein